MVGNIGLQASTTTLRAIATGYATTTTFGSVWKIVRKEIGSAFLIAFSAGLIIFAISFTWSQSAAFGLVTGLAIFVVGSTAGLLGTLGPISVMSLGIDPAMAAGPLETALQDVIGTLVYLGLSTRFLS